jgi:hypothetical protein
VNKVVFGVLAVVLVVAVAYLVFIGPAQLPVPGDQPDGTAGPQSSFETDEEVGDAITDIGSGIQNLTSTIRRLDDKIY